MPRRLVFACLLLFMVPLALPAADEGEDEFTSLKAKMAQRKYESELAKAQKALDDARVKLAKEYAKDLDKALKAAMKSGDLQEANRINGTLTALKDEAVTPSGKKPKARDLTAVKPDEAWVGHGEPWINHLPHDHEELAHPKLKDKRVEKFLFAHAHSKYTFPLEKTDRKFKATALSTGGRSMKFQIAVDDKIVFGKTLPPRGDAVLPVSVKLPRGAKKISLIVDPMEDEEWDVAFWCNPTLE